MSPPIYTPDGSEVSEIVLPDGSTASEVIGPDGNVVFEAGPDIPDSVVSRSDDDDTVDLTDKFGLRFNSTVEWPSIGGEISSNTANISTVYVYRVSDGILMGSADVSGITSGETFTVDNIDLSADTDYAIVADNNGSTHSMGHKNSASYPFTSTDGQLSLINGARGSDGTQTSTTAGVFKRIINVGFS